MRYPYFLQSGKNPKWIYFTKNFFRYITPKKIFQIQLPYKLKAIAKRKDIAYINERVAYYNKLREFTPLPQNAPTLSSHTYLNREQQSVYFFDTYEFTRWYPQTLQWNHLPGDVTHIPDHPAIVKSRPIKGNNANSVLLNLDKVRHFIFLKDKIPFEQKKNKVIFRGKVVGKPQRELFMQLYCEHPLVNAGDVSKYDKLPSNWKAQKMSLYEHFQYKFIMAIEGNDVASNLKWIMYSNSIAVMPEPTYETWFMEGKLMPDYHYIKVEKDFSDLETKINYYIKHTEKALAIIQNAHKYVEQFQDKEREKLISLLVLDNYFSHTNKKYQRPTPNKL